MFFLTSSEDLINVFGSTDSSECSKAPQLLHLQIAITCRELCEQTCVQPASGITSSPQICCFCPSFGPMAWEHLVLLFGVHPYGFVGLSCCDAVGS